MVEFSRNYRNKHLLKIPKHSQEAYEEGERRMRQLGAELLYENLIEQGAELSLYEGRILVSPAELLTEKNKNLIEYFYPQMVYIIQQKNVTV